MLVVSNTSHTTSYYKTEKKRSPHKGAGCLPLGSPVLGPPDLSSPHPNPMAHKRQCEPTQWEHEISARVCQWAVAVWEEAWEWSESSLLMWYHLSMWVVKRAWNSKIHLSMQSHHFSAPLSQPVPSWNLPKWTFPHLVRLHYWSQYGLLFPTSNPSFLVLSY